MSEMRANKLSSQNGLNATELHRQNAAKAYAALNQVSSYLGAGLNISSAVDAGVGTWVANFVSAMVNSQYPVASACYADYYGSKALCWPTTASQMVMRHSQADGAYLDNTWLCSTAFGVLA